MFHPLFAVVCCTLQGHNIYQPIHVLLSASSQELEPCGADRAVRKHCRRAALQHLVLPALAAKQPAEAAARAVANTARDACAAAADACAEYTRASAVPLPNFDDPAPGMPSISRNTAFAFQLGQVLGSIHQQLQAFSVTGGAASVVAPMQLHAAAQHTL